MKIIKFYRKNQYGIEREYIHPDFEVEKIQIGKLTRQTTISRQIRDAIEILSSNSIKFEEVIAP